MDILGLKIRLRKVNPNYNKGIEKKTTKEIIAFGHYDAMAIEPIDTLSDFRPGKEIEPIDTLSDFRFGKDAEQTTLGADRYYTEYTLKLVAVDSKKLSDDNKNEHGYWSNFGKNAVNNDIDLPFLAVVSVDIKDDKLNKTTKLQQYQDLICDLCNVKDNKVLIAPYLCLGYTDFVILVRSKSLDAILKYIVNLRNKADISSTYSVVGVLKGVNADNISDLQNISARFEWSLKEIKSDKNPPDFFKNFPYGVTFGVFDRYADMQLIERDFYKLFNEYSPYFDEKDVTQDGDIATKEISCNNIIKNFNTYLNYSDGDINTGIEGNGESSKKSISLINNNDEALKALDKFLKSYKKLIDKTQSHKRLHKAMQEMGRFYGYIILTCHSQDVKKVFGGFYADFLKSISSLVEKIKSGKITQEEFEESEPIEKLNSAIEEFRTLFGDLLFDILRSDHSFFEAPSVAHPSIGSTTKLLLAYNNIVNGWNKKIGTENGHHYVSFLITSGGCDVTRAHNLLYDFESHIKPKGEDKEKYKLPVIITIPEASLYDVEGTLFRLAHEFFHLKGERNREGRFSHYYRGLFYEYIDFCCNYIANKKSLISCSEGNNRLKPISAREFHIQIERKNFKAKGYQSISSLMKELNGNSITLYEEELKQNIYSKIIKQAFETFLFIAVPVGYGGFKQTLYDFYYGRCSIEDFYRSFEKNFKANGRFKKIDAYNDNICRLFDRAFKDYESQVILLGENKAKEILKNRLLNIFEYVPYDADSYVQCTATYIPQLIGELGDLYANIEYAQVIKSSEQKIVKSKLIYDYSGGRRNEYNVKGFEEYKEDNGSGIKNLPAESDFYSRLWLRATIAFFQDNSNFEPKFYENDVEYIPLNYGGYEYLLLKLYKECFADACALYSLKPIYKEKDEDLIALYISSFIFEHHNIEQFFEIADIKGCKEQKTINILLAIRIAVVIDCAFPNEGTIHKIDFSSNEVAQRVLDRIGYIYHQDGNGDSQMENAREQLISVLDTIKNLFNQKNNNKYSGFSGYIYIDELIEYVKSGIEGEIGDKNIIQYPNFSKDLTDKEKVDRLFDWWLKSYNKQA